jgi:hypothetical protein
MADFLHEILKNWQVIVSVAAIIISLLQWRTAKQQRLTAKQQAEIRRTTNCAWISLTIELWFTTRC